MKHRTSLAWSLCIMVIVAACSSAVGASSAPESQTWRTTPLVDVRTGKSFTIDGLRGSLVAIEPMAAWCTSCAIQQGESRVAIDQIANPNLVYVSLGVDPNERPADLAKYADGKGYEWPFVVAGKDVSRSLAATFGDQILSPPSTPLILIGPDGDVIQQDFGIHGADDLIKLFSQNLP